MANTLKLPVGIENFEEIRKLGFYYIDKTRLIEQLLQGWGKVTLFTRPRRLGKTLNMSMLKSFFEIGTDKSLFDCLYISGNKELCDEYMGKYAQNRKDTLMTYLEDGHCSFSNNLSENAIGPFTVGLLEKLAVQRNSKRCHCQCTGLHNGRDGKGQ